MRLLSPHFLHLLLATSLAPPTSARTAKDATLLTNVKALTLRASQPTTSRRVAAVPQLSCVGGDGCAFHTIDVMRCRNSGVDYDDQAVQWTCQASLPPEFRLGSTDVVCEGYDSPDDPYVLKGSCAVEYRLLLTDAGEEKYRDYLAQDWFSRTGRRAGEGGLLGMVVTGLFWVVFFGVIAIMLYRVFFPRGGQARPGRQGFFGNGGDGGGGGGDDGWDDPPPPYTPRTPRYKTAPGSSDPASWRPGFWSGTAAGAAAGYAAANWNNNRAARNQGAFAQPPRAGPSNWFGGRAASGSGSGLGGGGGGMGSASFPSPGTSRHQSTGFGGTRRR